MYKQWFFIVVNIFIFSAWGIIPRCNRPERSNDSVFPREKASSDSLRVLSYNIRGDSGIDKQHGNGWDARKNKIQYLVSDYQPDIIGLQGVSKHYMSDLKQLFPDYTCIAFDVNGESYDAVLLIRTDRFVVNDNQFFYLSEDQLKKSTAQKSVKNGRSRIALYATLFDYQTQKVCVVCCVHFESKGIDARINNAHILTQKLDKKTIDVPLILFGDFNFFVSNSVYAEKSQRAYALIIESLLMNDVRDLSEGCHYGPDGTWIGWPYDKHSVAFDAVGERLDGIFIRDCCVIQEGVLNLKVKDGNFIRPFDIEFNTLMYPSDHLPIIADVLVQ